MPVERSPTCELTRDTARWFNNVWKIFSETKHLLTKNFKSNSLLDPNKNSKSLGSSQNRA